MKDMFQFKVNPMLLVLFICGLFACEETHYENINPNEKIDLQAGTRNMPFWDPPVNAIHIDPIRGDNKTGNGTAENPFKSFHNVKIEENQVYAIKRSTTLHVNNIVIDADGVTIASYGIGKRPILEFSTDGHAISTKGTEIKNTTIRDIEVIASDATSCIKFGDYSKNMKIINCKLQGGEWGIRALLKIDGLIIKNTEIHNILDDGIFLKDCKNIEIYNCHIHRVNMKWKSPSTPEKVAGGDGIQLHLCDHWHVHHNRIDRSSTGNKFCFISNNPDQENGILEKNWFVAPITNGASVFIGDGREIIISNNFFQGSNVISIYSHSKDLKIYYNIFFKVKRPLYASHSAELYNNIFYKAVSGIEGGKIISKNNIFELASMNNNPYKVDQLTESNNLHSSGLPRAGSYVGDPGFIDPENLNFHLSPNSVCIDNGTWVGIEQDFEGKPVPSGEAPDIGIYEK